MARHNEAFFCRWAWSRLELPEGNNEDEHGPRGETKSEDSAGAPSPMGKLRHDQPMGVAAWSDGELMASLVLSLFGDNEPAAVRLKRWRAGPLRVQRVARVVAALAVLDERSPPDLPMQGNICTADLVVDGDGAAVVAFLRQAAAGE
jgi:hypothetical protein